MMKTRIFIAALMALAAGYLFAPRLAATDAGPATRPPARGHYQFDWKTLVPLGLQSNCTAVDKFGRNADVDTGTDPEDIWNGGGLYSWPDSAQILEVASDSITDDSSSLSTGAYTIRIHGLDSAFLAITEDVVMDGDTTVETTQAFRRVRHAEVLAAGGSHRNNGAITVTYQDDATAAAVIAAGQGQSLMAIYTVPAGKYAIMPGVYGSINGPAGANANLALYERPNANLATSAWLLRRIAGLDMDGAGAFRQSWEPYRLIQPRTDIRLTVDVVSADNGDISAGFGLVLVDTARYTNLVLY